jgi:putative sigma-54 modulation protein
MNMSIVGRHVDLTDSLKEYIQENVETLKKYNLDIISIRAILSAEEKNGKKGFTIEFTINLAHKNTVVIKQRDKDLYSAIDLAIDRAQKVLRRHHDKVVGHRVTTLEELGGKEAEKIEKAEAFGSDDEIVPVELELYKPMEVEEALNRLRDSQKQFYVFNDLDDKMRVIYKRTDGKYGLY